MSEDTLTVRAKTVQAINDIITNQTNEINKLSSSVYDETQSKVAELRESLSKNHELLLNLDTLKSEARSIINDLKKLYYPNVNISSVIKILEEAGFENPQTKFFPAFQAMNEKIKQFMLNLSGIQFNNDACTLILEDIFTDVGSIDSDFLKKMGLIVHLIPDLFGNGTEGSQMALMIAAIGFEGSKFINDAEIQIDYKDYRLKARNNFPTDADSRYDIYVCINGDNLDYTVCGFPTKDSKQSGSIALKTFDCPIKKLERICYVGTSKEHPSNYTLPSEYEGYPIIMAHNNALYYRSSERTNFCKLSKSKEEITPLIDTLQSDESNSLQQANEEQLDLIKTITGSSMEDITPLKPYLPKMLQITHEEGHTQDTQTAYVHLATNAYALRALIQEYIKNRSTFGIGARDAGRANQFLNKAIRTLSHITADIQDNNYANKKPLTLDEIKKEYNAFVKIINQTKELVPNRGTYGFLGRLSPYLAEREHNAALLEPIGNLLNLLKQGIEDLKAIQDLKLKEPNLTADVGYEADTEEGKIKPL